MKRSSSASGSGYVPSNSTGFWVANTVNTGESAWLVPSIVTVRSCIASRSAAWVLAGARLISSARTRSAKIGPGRNVNSCVPVRSETPVMSAGMRSGVNWMRWNRTSRASASERTSSVLAVPGTPSSSTWPRASRHTTTSRVAASWPSTTDRMASRMRPASCAGAAPPTRPPRLARPRPHPPRGGGGPRARPRRERERAPAGGRPREPRQRRRRQRAAAPEALVILVPHDRAPPAGQEQGHGERRHPGLAPDDVAEVAGIGRERHLPAAGVAQAQHDGATVPPREQRIRPARDEQGARGIGRRGFLPGEGLQHGRHGWKAELEPARHHGQAVSQPLPRTGRDPARASRDPAAVARGEHRAAAAHVAHHLGDLRRLEVERRGPPPPPPPPPRSPPPATPQGAPAPPDPDAPAGAPGARRAPPAP